MGRKPELTPEERALRDLIRQAHEASQELRQAIREARRLAEHLVEEFEAIHAREVKQLSNFLAEESNRHAAGLNADVRQAREMIFNQIMAGELVLSADRQEVSLTFGATQFDDHQPLPYPEIPPKENQQ